MIGDAFETKSEVLLNLGVNRHMKVGIREIYGCDSIYLSEGGMYRLWGLHLEFWYGQEFVQQALIYDCPPAVAWVWYQEQTAVEPHTVWSLQDFDCAFPQQVLNRGQ